MRCGGAIVRIASPRAVSGRISQPRELALIVISDFLDPEGVFALDHQQLFVRPHAHDFVGVHEVAGADLGAGRAGMLTTLKNAAMRSEEHTSELQSLMRISYAVFC